MTFDVFAVHVALSLLLFLTLNWLGRHAAGSGYITLGLFLKEDGAPAFNLLYRIVGPIVFVILASSSLYALGLDYYVHQIWLVIAYYYLGRFLYVVSFDRTSLLNWKREIFFWVASIGLGWLLYDQVIRSKKALLPDVAHINNYLWTLIALFVYTALNSMRFDSTATKRRKSRYLYIAYSDNKLLYDEIIRGIAQDRLAESIIYSILIYESFNRPSVPRVLERLFHPWLGKTLGPMQVKADRRISDSESVTLGAQIVADLYDKALEEGRKIAADKGVIFDPNKTGNHREFIISRVAAKYNKDDSYVSEVRELHGIIVREFYPEFAPPPPDRYSDYLI